jgi:lytic murein transglycosylase
MSCNAASPAPRRQRARSLLLAFAAGLWLSAGAGSAAQMDPTAPAPSATSADFQTWKAGFIDRAVAHGFDRGFVEAELADVTPDPAVLALDGKQPEFSRPVGDYIRASVAPARVAEARARLQDTADLPAISQRYGVPAEILVGIWAEESGFGRLQGDFDVLRAFATLAYDGRRRAWAETQLMDALTILRDRGVPRSRLRGSWAGAMGQTQFIPEAYLKLGQDGDGDGHVDLWTSPADALASAANLLAHEGWKPGESWAVEAALPPDFDYRLAEAAAHTPAWWAEHGVRRADGLAWSAADAGSTAVLLLPAGARGPAFFAFPNHFVIRKYNNSTAYALAVGLIADGARGVPPPLKPWPYETPLSRAQRIAAQTALAKLGYPVGEIDGVIGTGARAALKAWQTHEGLVPDGYLTPDLVVRLSAEAGAAS